MRRVCLGPMPAVWLSAVVALAQTTNVAVKIAMTGTAYGVPGNIEMESVPPHGVPGSITYNGTSINFDSIELIGGPTSTELLVSATANTNQGASGEVLIFFDLSPTLSLSGRAGTLVLTHGTGPYFGSSISLPYTFKCTSACATTINANKSGPFDADFNAAGSAVFPSTIQIPRIGGGAPTFVSPPSGSVIQRIKNYFAPQVYGSVAPIAVPFLRATPDAASSGGLDGALVFATPVQFVPTTYTASADLR